MGQDIRPKITVLMPVFNCEKYVKTAISSILDQTYKNFEFLIINDGSTDLSEIIIKSFNDERINYVYNDENKGLVFTLNKGISLAKGELIARMDADDWAYSHRLELQVKFMIKNPNIGICGSNVEVWDGFHVNGIWDYPTYNEEIQIKLFFKCSLAHPSVMVRKGLLREYNFHYSEAYFPAEDYELWTRISKVTELYNFKTPLLKYRKSETQISKRRNQEQENKSLEISWNQVLNMNIEKCDNYKLLHCEFLLDKWPNNLEKLKKLVEWLELLSLSNAKSNIYKQKYFSQELAHRLWRICYFLTRKDFDCIGIYKNSILSKYYMPSLLERLKVFIKLF